MKAVQVDDWVTTRAMRLVRAVVQTGLIFPALSCFCRVTAVGRESLQALNGPAVFVANHVSELDAVVMAAALPPRLRRQSVVVAARDSVFKHKAKARLAQVVVCAVPISRTGGARPYLDNLKQLIERGWSVIMFPEGRVTVTGAMATFRKGAAMIAMDSRVPVVPTYVDGMYGVMRTFRRVPRPGRVTVTFGPQMLAGEGENYARFTARIESTVRELAGPKGVAVDPPTSGSRALDLSYWPSR